ncbi:MAG: hypothetical protein WCD53_23855 [Microcoleus sp.]
MGIGVIRGDRLRSGDRPSSKSSIARSPEIENYLKVGDVLKGSCTLCTIARNRKSPKNGRSTKRKLFPSASAISAQTIDNNSIAQND